MFYSMIIVLIINIPFIITLVKLLLSPFLSHRITKNVEPLLGLSALGGHVVRLEIFMSIYFTWGNNRPWYLLGNKTIDILTQKIQLPFNQGVYKFYIKAYPTATAKVATVELFVK